MKKFLSAIIALGILAITLAGCSSSDCQTLTVSIHGGMDTGKITPGTVTFKAGQFATITVDGAIYRKPALGDPSIINLEEVIRLKYADKEYMLAIGGKTEIRAGGVIDFSLHRSHLPGTVFLTGKVGKTFSVGDARLKVCLSENSQGGSPPREIKEISVPSLDGAGNAIQKVADVANGAMDKVKTFVQDSIPPPAPAEEVLKKLLGDDQEGLLPENPGSATNRLLHESAEVVRNASEVGTKKAVKKLQEINQKLKEKHHDTSRPD